MNVLNEKECEARAFRKGLKFQMMNGSRCYVAWGRYLWGAQRSAELHSISICQNRRGPRRFCGARLCEPQHAGSDRGAGFVNSLRGPQSSCGSQTRAPLVAASPRSEISGLNHEWTLLHTNAEGQYVASRNHPVGDVARQPRICVHSRLFVVSTQRWSTQQVHLPIVRCLCVLRVLCGLVDEESPRSCGLWPGLAVGNHPC